MQDQQSSAQTEPYLLWVLLVAFSVRVVGQLVQWRFEIPALPSFEAWQGDAAPLPVLAAAQALILFLAIRVAWGVATFRIRPSLRRAWLWLVPGLVYLFAAIMRGALGMTSMSGHPWFDQPFPTIFHIVLAMLVIATGFFHLRGARRMDCEGPVVKRQSRR